MTQTAALDPTDRLTGLIEGLMKDVEASVIFVEWVPIVLIKLLWRRLRRMKARFVSVLARLRAGTLPPPGGERRGRGPGSPDAAPRSPDVPVHYGWVIQTISCAFLRSWELAEILDDPGMAEAVGAAPQLGRVLRPLCHMLAVKQPGWLRRPRRRRPEPAAGCGHWEIIRVGAGEGWTRPDSLWPTREIAQKYDAKIRVWRAE